MAEQAATKTSSMRTYLEFIPQHLRDPKTENLLFPTEPEQRKFKEMLCSDLDLMKLIADKYRELSEAVGVKDEAKNSSKQESSENGN